MSNFSVLGVIPARSGSKRLPGKNIMPLAGKPLIQYTIDAAKNSELLTHCIVSTNDEEIAQVARECGGNAPFLRPDDLATDTTPDRPYLKHAVEWFEKENGFRPDAVALLRPTSPFKTAEMIDKGITKLRDSGADSLRSMTLVEGVHHPYWMFNQTETGLATPFDPENSIEKYNRSQLLPPLYRLNGVVDFMLTSVLFDDSKRLYGDSMQVLEISEEAALDIDTEIDFRKCEVYLKMQ